MKVKANQSFSDSTLGFVAAGATVDVDASTLKRVESLVETVQAKAPEKTVAKKTVKKPAKSVAKKSDTPGVDA